MTSDTPDDTNVLVIQPGQISPGCSTADAVLDGHSGWPQPESSVPTLSHRTTFAPTIIPTRAQDPWTTLSPGSFILFQLDKRELATQLHISKDSELPPTKKYVGLVMGAFGGDSDSESQDYTIAFVSKTLPPGSSQNSKRNMFAVPIVTAKGTEESAPGRPRLRARLFPWSGCYQYTVLGTRIVPTHTYRSAIEYKLDEQGFHDFDHLVVEDHMELVHQLHSITPSMSEDEALLFENMMVDTAIPLPVKVWQELTAVKECPDPREFVEEVLRFRELALAEAEELDYQ